MLQQVHPKETEAHGEPILGHMKRVGRKEQQRETALSWPQPLTAPCLAEGIEYSLRWQQAGQRGDWGSELETRSGGGEVSGVKLSLGKEVRCLSPSTLMFAFFCSPVIKYLC